MDFYDIDRYLKDKELLHLLFYDDSVNEYQRKEHLNKDVISSIGLNKKQNLIKPVLFEVLNNVKQTCINVGGHGHHPFSSLEFLSTIKNTSNINVTTKTNGYNNEEI